MQIYSDIAQLLGCVTLVADEREKFVGING